MQKEKSTVLIYGTHYKCICDSFCNKGNLFIKTESNIFNKNKIENP